MEIVCVVEKIDNEMIKAEIGAKIDELTDKSVKDISVTSHDAGKNVKKYTYPKFKLNFTTKIVNVHGTDNFTFQNANSNTLEDLADVPLRSSHIDSSTRADSMAFSGKFIGDAVYANQADEVVDEYQSYRVCIPGCDIVINSFLQILRKMVNVDKMGLKIYLIPSNEKMSKLASYLAVRDSLYSTLIYRPFLNNPYFEALPDDKFDGYTFQEFVDSNFVDPEELGSENKLKFRYDCKM